MTRAVEARGAFRIFDSAEGRTVALQGLDLTVDPGELVVVLGPSGSGKTTLLRAIAGFERLSAGSIAVFGTELERLGGRELAAFRARHLGFLDQHYRRALSPDLRVRDSVSLQLALLGADPSEAHRATHELLDRVGLLDRGQDRPDTLSGGEQQRVSLCAAIAHRPRLLLADEPAGELDAESAATVYRALRELVRDNGSTALVVSHDPAAVEVADRIVHIRDGRVVEETVAGKPAALVVSRSGWIRLPSRLLDDVGGPSRVVAEPAPGALLLRRAGPPSAPGSDEPTRRPRATNGSSAIVSELRAVAKRYPRGNGEHTVFSGIDREIRGRRFLAVAGRSGSGKTTLLLLLAGLERASEGEVLVLGEALGGKSRAELAAVRRRHVALVTQDPGLVPYLSARENVELGLQVRDRNGRAGRAEELLKEVGLGPRLEQCAGSLSAGERQRVAIARALAVDAELLLVDEPTARLDEETGRAAGALLARAAHERGVAVVCATHDPALLELADEVLGLAAGAAG